MEFIYTDSNRVELGFLSNVTLDIDVGLYQVSKNDFELKTSELIPKFGVGSFFYSTNTEYGGMVEGVKVDTAKNTITYKGSTMRGLLTHEYIQPPTGQDHLTLKGSAKECMEILLKDRFDGLFVVDECNYECNYKVRDLNLLEALEKTLKTANCKLHIEYRDYYIHLVAKPIVDLSDLIQYDNSYNLNMIVEKTELQYNHILALGKGEMQERLRTNLYLVNGKWVENPTNFGLYNRTYKYDNSNIDNIEELKQEAIEKVPIDYEKLQISFKSDDAELFDIVGAKEEITGISFKQSITQKILKGSPDNIKIDYQIGE